MVDFQQIIDFWVNNVGKFFYSSKPEIGALIGLGILIMLIYFLWPEKKK